MDSRTWRLWSLLSLAGIALMALPDRGERLFSLSRTHGPAALDAVGAAALVVSWSLLWASVWRRRHRLPRSWSWWTGMMAVLACGTALLAWSVVGDHGTWWLAGAAVVAGVQVRAAVQVSDRGTRADAHPDGMSDGQARTYRLFVRFAASAFLLVALYTVLVKGPAGELRQDWLHTGLHLLTGIVAAYLGWQVATPVLLRGFTVALLAGYGTLSGVGMVTGGIALDTTFSVPLQAADNVFHGVLAAAAAATVMIASKRSTDAHVVLAGE